MNVAIDLDGTLARWADDSGVVGEWIEGAREAVERLLLAGHRVIVHTCRATWPLGGGADAVLAFVESGRFAPVRVVGNEILIAAPEGSKRSWELEPRRFVECPAGDCRNGLVSEADPCERCRGNGVLLEPFEVGVWVGQGKPVAHWYVDDRAVPFDEMLGWENALGRLEKLSGEPILELV